MKLNRIIALASIAISTTTAFADREGNSFTAVKLSVFENGQMQAPKEMSMLANLTKTPSFEYSVPGTNARFLVMPRLVRLPG